MSSPTLVDLLRKLTSADGGLIRETTSQLKKYLSSDESVGELFVVLSDVGEEVGVRNAAGVMLRKKLRVWDRWSVDQQAMLRSGLIRLLGVEKDKKMLHNLVELCARAFCASYEASGGRLVSSWPELMEYICCGCGRVDDVSSRELCYSLLYSVLNSLTDDACPLLGCVAGVLASGMRDAGSARVRYECLKSVAVLVTDSECWGEGGGGGEEEDEGVAVLAGLVGEVPATIRSLLPPAVAADSVSFDSDLFDVFGSCVTHTRLMRLIDLTASVELAIEVMGCGELDAFVRKGALGYIVDLTRVRSSVIAKMEGAAETVLRRVFGVMCGLEENEYEHDSLLQQCTQTIDTLAQRLPSSVIVPTLLGACIEPAVADPHTYTRRAAFLALAVSVEGCCRYYAEHSITQLMQIILQGIVDPHSVVSLSALFALGELLSYAESYAAQYGATFMPVILDALTKVGDVNYEESQEDVQLWISRLFYALEEACECLDNELVPYLGDLFSRLFTIQKTNPSQRMQQFVFESVSFAVSAVDKLIAPYVDGLLDVVGGCIKARECNNECLAFTEALSALSNIFRYAETPQLRSYADSTANFAMQLLTTNADQDEPAERSAAYDVMAALTYVYKEKVDRALVSGLVEQALKTFNDDQDDTDLRHILRNGSSIDEDDDEDHVPDDDDVDDDVDDDDDDDDEFEILERDYADERVSALNLLSDLSVNSEESLVPHFDKIWSAVHRHLDHPDEDIQNNAIRCACCLLVMCFNVASKDSAAVDEARIQGMLVKLYDELEDKIKESEVHAMVISALNGIQILLSGFEKALFSVIAIERVANMLELVLTRKISCLNTAVDTDVDLEEPELDGLVMEAAGDVLPGCATCDPDDFSRHFSSCIAVLLNQLKRPNSARKAFVVATLACCINNQPKLFVDESIAFELFNTLMTDQNDEVSQNSVYGMRVLVNKAPAYCAPHFEHVLNTLHALVSQKKPQSDSTNKHSPSAALLDNICGCACSILKAVATHAPESTSKTILDFILNLLPLNADKENYGPLFECMTSEPISNAEFANNDSVAQKLCQEAIKTIVQDEADLSPDGQKALLKYLANQAHQKRDLLLKTLETCSEQQRNVVMDKITNNN
uniref:Importin 4 n=1 Tax=Fundulus heteroclitus TaxID=8078 RepID=A0A146UTL1_FUNHE